VVLTLASVPLSMKVLMQRYGAEVVALDVPADRWMVMRASVEERGWVPMSGYVNPPSGSNPFGVDGYKTIAYELFEQLGGRAPDVVVVPVGYGDSVTGILRGFQDLQQFGVIDRVPRLVGTEVYGHYSRAMGLPSTAVSRETDAFSIAVGAATWQGVDSLQRADGTVVVVTNEELRHAQVTLGREGLSVEASCAAPYAALNHLLATDAICRQETIVLLNTSTGLKDIDLSARHLPSVPLIEPSLQALDRALATL
jgi:threonine synthase